ncbi:MAG: exodeoxyribonuclease VII small subunit [Clostridia bacterium]|nr:exodeoxyribonuclease VII small subunit [Clostridia bacterium]
MSKTDRSENQEMQFEAALARLEELVRGLEEGSATLDESLSAFEEGIGLVRLCTERLRDAEQRVKVLIENESGFEEQDA